MFKPPQLRSLLPRKCFHASQPQRLRSIQQRLQSTTQQPPLPQSQSYFVRPEEQSPPPTSRTTLQRPNFERGPADPRAIPPPRDESFHPAFAGFLAGAMFSFAMSYVIFHFSGTSHVRKASETRRKKLNEEQDRILGIASTKPTLKSVQGEKEDVIEKEVDVHEALDWLKMVAQHFTAFMPNSDIYLQNKWQEVEKVMSSGGEDLNKKALEICRECAAELKKEGRDGAIGLYIGRTSWDIARKYVDKIAALDVEGINSAAVIAKKGEDGSAKKSEGVKKGWW
jgi:hypothetical protein